MENLYKAEAAERKRSGKKLEDVPTVALGRTRDKIAEKAKVSHDTIDKVKKIEEKADEKTKKKLASGEITINKAFNEIKKEEKKEERQKQAEIGSQLKIDIAFRLG